MFDQYVEEIKSQAVAAYPNEAVWLITSKGCYQAENIAREPTKTFRVSKLEMVSAQAEGLLAVVHSHPDFPDCPSEADMRGQMASGVPWGITATDGESATDIRWVGVATNAPLVGRSFVHGTQDCYALIRDYYSSELGIELPDFPRSWEWWLNGKNLYLDGFEAAGFEVVSSAEAKPGDMWLAQLRGNVPSHGGVLLNNGLALHHPSGKKPVDPSRLSVREPITRWLPYITHWMRHKSRADI